MNKDGKRDYITLENHILDIQRTNPKCVITNTLLGEGLGWTPPKVSQNLKLSVDKGRLKITKTFKVIHR